MIPSLIGFLAVVVVVALAGLTAREYYLDRKNKKDLAKFYEYKTKRKL